MCRKHGAVPPTFEETQGFVTVTFKAQLVVGQVIPHVTPQVTTVLEAASEGVRSREELQTAAGIKDREHFRKAYLEPLLNAGWMERTVPDKPRSRMQRYRTTKAGRGWC